MSVRARLGGIVVLMALTAGCTGAGPTAIPAAAALSGVDTPVPVEGVTVSGMGRVSGRPDVLRATLGVEVVRPTVEAALDEANARAEAVIQALQASGVAEADIQTLEFAVHPQYRHVENAQPETTGYQVVNLVQAKVRDLDQVGQVLADAVAAGGDSARVQGVSFALEDNEELLSAARAAAFADARDKAEQYAELAERDLGQLVSVSEVTADVPPPMPFAEQAAAAAGDSAVPFASGEQEVAVTVNVSWSLN